MNARFVLFISQHFISKHCVPSHMYTYRGSKLLLFCLDFSIFLKKIPCRSHRWSTNQVQDANDRKATIPCCSSQDSELAVDSSDISSPQIGSTKASTTMNAGNQTAPCDYRGRSLTGLQTCIASTHLCLLNEISIHRWIDLCIHIDNEITKSPDIVHSAVYANYSVASFEETSCVSFKW